MLEVGGWREAFEPEGFTFLGEEINLEETDLGFGFRLGRWPCYWFVVCFFDGDGIRFEDDLVIVKHLKEELFRFFFELIINDFDIREIESALVINFEFAGE